MFRRYLVSRSGQGMSEYLILVLLIAVGSIAAAKSIGTTVFSKLNEIHTKLEKVNFGDVSHGQTLPTGDQSMVDPGQRLLNDGHAVVNDVQKI